mmetsp:Transcript_1509/g.2429  ORF Transcript_1509/g.2429 Transcript_1509/m.2429 type:complete len:166 (-) Transcript_1509:710-1207(-)
MEFNSIRRRLFHNDAGEDSNRDSLDVIESAEESEVPNDLSYTFMRKSLEKSGELLSSRDLNKKLMSDLLSLYRDAGSDTELTSEKESTERLCYPNCSANEEIKAIRTKIECLNGKLDASTEVLKEREIEYNQLKEVVSKLEQNVGKLVEHQHLKQACCSQTCILI